jgi:hypothetical protein
MNSLPDEIDQNLYEDAKKGGMKQVLTEQISIKLFKYTIK